MANTTIENNVTPTVKDPGFRNSPQVSYGRQSSVGGEQQAESILGRVVSQGRNLFSDASTGMKSHINASPWLTAGGAALSFFAIGYWLGIRYSRPSLTSPNFDIDEIDAAAAEDLTIGRSY